MYKILALIGESGSGKDTIMKEVVRKQPLHKIVNCTSRPIRENEVDGVNYHFYTAEDFQERIKKGEILEYAVFNNWYYGTSFDSLKEDQINIGAFNPAAIRQLMTRDDV
jgi:guanylate kinase